MFNADKMAALYSNLNYTINLIFSEHLYFNLKQHNYYISYAPITPI